MFKEILKELLNPFSKLNIKIALFAIVFITIALIIPNLALRWIYPYRTNINNITIHTHQRENLTPLLKNVTQKLKRADVINTVSHTDIYFINNSWLFKLLTPFNPNGFASNNTLFNKIYIAHTNLSTNQSFSNSRAKQEKLDNLIAHELTHSLLREIKPKLALWKEEGYCEYIAYDRKVDIKTSLNLYMKERDIYTKYRIVVAYLLTKHKNNFNAFIQDTSSLTTTFREIELKVKKTQCLK